ncbi:hypothetical protein Curi_c15020 [Gottschalkia acidurici 9a]|uniref:Uncharacterized protein n=1 Tax=Gottschalkia acidurici (strain ATCC 7906 / DSM 604 / BCRC 14475 / CIP 104303 / KCTC 5404 / NCIMB 10678 / 9a) TaxID=1128398 RepID=K0B1F9_GOTA9|nr:hypothetical protein [Gottschalkia acidurici]AFS78511.1 hypothetical protein Curi_c15020 [Gottschalkia acidurici 9a]
MNDKRVVDWSSFRVELNGLGAVNSFDITLPLNVKIQLPQMHLNK